MVGFHCKDGHFCFGLATKNLLRLGKEHVLFWLCCPKHGWKPNVPLKLGIFYFTGVHRSLKMSWMLLEIVSNGCVSPLNSQPLNEKVYIVKLCTVGSILLIFFSCNISMYQQETAFLLKTALSTVENGKGSGIFHDWFPVTTPSAFFTFTHSAVSDWLRMDPLSVIFCSVLIRWRLLHTL